ncbi:outer membrane protein assembly factor BamC [uncultured Shewanella sp.]|uniref:outer membrane protein assembly factor BamC n=1 Tax=uncultured Shewanella sp. TaxID=173975 RepID=UPI002609793B|nr:outer membrane protein assembly factor BamC [uncultured Shewanella sp.]
MLKQVTPILLIAAVTACSTPTDRRVANGNEDFVNAKSVPLLTIPEGLTEPTYSREYDIPSAGEDVNKELIGKRLDIRPPLLVLPMSEGTRVEEGSDNIKIIVESIPSTTDLKQEVFDNLKGFLAKYDVAVEKEDYESGVLETAWIENRDVIETSWFGADKVYLLRQRYRYDVDVSPHGRSGSMSIDLVEHEESYDGEEQEIFLSGEDQRRYTIDMLNNTIAYMSVTRDKQIKADRIEQSLGIDVDLVAETEETGAYWVAEADFTKTWDRLRIVMPELGFDIVDMNSAKGLYYIVLEESGGFWSSLWGEDKLPLERGNYRVELEENDDNSQTKIFIKNAAGDPLDNEVVTELYRVLNEAMKADRKVR